MSLAGSGPQTRPTVERRLYIAQGEHVVSDHPDTVITTILGSCVAVCLWDPATGVGGMNHILLPDFGGRGEAVPGTGVAGAGVYRFGAALMEVLINDVLKAGAGGSRLRAKLFGGAAMLGAATEIGPCNVAFVRQFLRREGIAIEAASTGGTRARQIRFWPNGGQARQRLVVAAARPAAPAVLPKASDVELF
ncbi:chemotaxis protein CheD [Palleronia sp. KMU-117]|uniref:chemotaxis protein CheD n=1 Tax=Palleronia sp. KMU-117 TaxID=3434108 RepID=UPI003D703343